MWGKPLFGLQRAVSPTNFCIDPEFLKSAGFRPNDTLTAEIKDGKIILSRAFRHRTLRERAEAYGGELRLSDEMNWGEPRGSEVW